MHRDPRIGRARIAGEVWRVTEIVSTETRKRKPQSDFNIIVNSIIILNLNCVNVDLSIIFCASMCSYTGQDCYGYCPDCYDRCHDLIMLKHPGEVHNEAL